MSCGIYYSRDSTTAHDGQYVVMDNKTASFRANMTKVEDCPCPDQGQAGATSIFLDSVTVNTKVFNLASFKEMLEAPLRQDVFGASDSFHTRPAVQAYTKKIHAAIEEERRKQARLGYRIKSWFRRLAGTRRTAVDSLQSPAESISQLTHDGHASININQLKPSCNCKAAKEVRWLGITWLGVPYPKRLKLSTQWPIVSVSKMPGCGCIKALKNLYTRLTGQSQPVITP